ncbi:MULTISPECIES: heparinase II/III family protein [unclassified Microbacterium]|uniref:heparinase II/III domain-containing protein n=1 Tax=unclassified Microbacterium TaxID=2609290 RepID=UPI000A87A730|nr:MULTISPECIES: heparinase II/III family protein [unclassified Microbacterium]
MESETEMAPTRFAGPLAVELDALSLTSLPLVAPDDALPLPPASDREVWDAVDAATLAELGTVAESERGTPWPQPLASQAVRVHRDGDREVWERPAFERQRRLSRAAVMAATTGDDVWLDEVADGVVLLCEQSSWCWPAHDDTLERHGAVLATTTDPFLDLGAGEAVAQLAWIDQLLGAQLDERYPGLRARIRDEARRRVIDPFVTRRDWHWIGLDGDVHNWNPWIHGNVLVAALRLLDAPDESALRAEVVRLSVEGLDRYVAALPADGAIDEGYEYWWNGACRALEALDVLAHATGSVVELGARVPALRATVAFPHRMHLGGPWYLNLADGQARPVEPKPWHALYRAALRAGDAASAAHARAQLMAGAPVADAASGAGRLLRALADAEWRDATSAAAVAAGASGAGGAPTGEWLAESLWLPDVEVLLARERAGTAAGLTLAIKGGHNGEHHNHNDVGSFVVARDGVPVLVDAGRPTYTKQTFGPDRYDIWTMQSQWHSLPVVAGGGQPPGARFRARSVAAAPADATMSLDLASAYDVPGLTSLVRTAHLDRATGQVSIHDRWEADGEVDGELDVVEHLIVAGEVELIPGGARVHPVGGGGTVLLRWDGGLDAQLDVRELDDPMLTAVWGTHLTRVRIDVATRGTFHLTVERDDMIAKDHR